MEDDYLIDRIQNVIKQLVHASAVQMSRYEALGKFGEHSSGYSCSRLMLRLFRAPPNVSRASNLDIRTLLIMQIHFNQEEGFNQMMKKGGH